MANKCLCSNLKLEGNLSNMSIKRKYSHSMTIMADSFAFLHLFRKHAFCNLIIEEVWQCVLYRVRHTNSSQKELCLIVPKNKRPPYFLLMFGRPQIIDKNTGLKV